MKTALEDLECSMDGLECSAVQATKQQYLKLDQNNYHQLELLLRVDYILIKSYTYFASLLSKITFLSVGFSTSSETQGQLVWAGKVKTDFSSPNFFSCLS